jgi:hypothetical protein
MFKRMGFLRIVLAIFLALFSASMASAGKKSKGRLDTFEKTLEQMEFNVQEGLVDFPDIVDMCCECQIFSCFANNPSSPYGVFVLPPAPGQEVKNPYAEWFEVNEDNDPNNPWYDENQKDYPDGGSWFWRLRPDEAVVFLGTTPPEMTYFGFTAYLYDRYSDGAPKPPVCTADGKPDRDPPDSSLNRIPVFASIGDTTNNRTVSVSGAKKNPFLKDVVFILTADQKVERQVRKALHKAGYGDEMINTIVIPQDLVRFGVNSESDSLLFLIRMATKITPTNPNPAVERYMASPGTLFRLTPKKSSRLDPFPPAKLRVRGVGDTEVKLLPLVDQLGEAIVKTFNNYKAETISTVNWYEGYNCIENNENCMGDNRDTPYVLPGFNPLIHVPYQDLTLDDDKEFYVAYGVNHKASGKAIYSNISVYGWERKCSPVVIDDEDMDGSASAYLETDDPTADMLYAYVIARDCSKEDLTGEQQHFCREVKDNCKVGVPSGEPIAIGFRAYVEPKTNVGPAYSEIVLDRIIKFTRLP